MKKELVDRKVSGRSGLIRKKGAVCVLLLIFLLTACGGVSKSSKGSYESAEEPEYAAAQSKDFSAEEDAESGEEMFYASESAGSAVEPDAGGNGSSDIGEAASGSTSGSDPDSPAAEGSQSSSRKIVYTGSISLQSLEYEKSAGSIHEKITKYGGFIEEEVTSNDDPYWYYRNRPASSRDRARRNMNVTARIPADKFDAFMEDLKNDGQVTDTSVNARNISVKYATHDASRKALEIEQDRLLKMMDKAQTVEEMIAVEKRLTQVERELNDEKTQLSDMDRDVNFSTVYISLQAVFEYSEKVVEYTYGERLKQAFDRAISGFVEFWQELILWIVETFPFLIMLGIIIFAIVKLSGRSRRRRAEMLAKMQSAQNSRGGYPFTGPQTGTGMPGGIETPGEPRKKGHSFFRRHVNNHRDLMPGQSQEGTPVQPPQPAQPPQPSQPSQPVPGTAEQETQSTAPQQTDLTGRQAAGTGAAETGQGQSGRQAAGTEAAETVQSGQKGAGTGAAEAGQGQSGQHSAGTEDAGGKTEK